MTATERLDKHAERILASFVEDGWASHQKLEIGTRAYNGGLVQLRDLFRDHLVEWEAQIVPCTFGGVKGHALVLFDDDGNRRDGSVNGRKQILYRVPIGNIGVEE